MIQQVNWKVKCKEHWVNVKVHKLSTNNVDDLTLRPIVSNIGTSTYKTAKYLASLLAPRSKSEFTINNTKE